MLLKLYKPVLHRLLGSVGRIVATAPNYLSTSDLLNRYRHKVEVIPNEIGKSTYPHVSEERLTYCRGQLGTRFVLFTAFFGITKGCLSYCRLLREPVIPSSSSLQGPMRAI
jgi:hypothetical protein